MIKKDFEKRLRSEFIAFDYMINVAQCYSTSDMGMWMRLSNILYERYGGV